ncbi:GTPase-associated protein 1-related protein [Plantactinospora soyae]|uniref:Uncharacterized protein n=1 Tax=Plantactinospora soyae TaxID=1544732 RepID=A0A927R3K5_9ACTN|nr:GTPase-associated protein 1-related protein [Plantactinospora soyae]MBE1491923.1 hypothetical protein [Plantactinospora soyae]
MTAPEGQPGFDTLIYTDCRAGQGLRGAVGLQFQARSAGADEAAMAVVQRNLLYEPPARWMRERRSVSDYPPSFAHVWDGHLATAAGVYLGKEVNGSREGNQLTHSVVTRDPAAYGPVRPAQLFGATFWTDRPAPTTQSPPVPPGWQPGPIGIEDAQKFVLDQPDGRQTLIALVSALEEVTEPGARRVLFVADAPAPVLHWITAATLLLPRNRALAIGFKVFTTNPAYATQPVVAVHPDWGTTDARVDNDLGYAVFDLVHGGCSEVPSTRHAETWVPLFCAEDPYDIVDAIEVAAASGLGRHAPVLGLAATLRRRQTPEQAAILLRWLRDSDRDLLAGWRGPVVDLLAESVDELPSPVLLAFDEVARSGQVPADRVAPVRLALITAEIQRAYRDAEVAGVVLPALPAGTWLPEHQAAAERAVLAALRGAPPAAFDAVLRVASRFELAVRIADIRDEAGRFVDDWAQHRRAYEPAGWPCGEELDAMLVDGLCEQIARDPARGAGIGDGWWRQRWRGCVNGATPFDQAVLGAAMVHLDPDRRLDLVRLVFRDLPAADDPRRLAGELAEILWARRPATHEELQLLLDTVPRDTVLPHVVCQALCAELLDGKLTEQVVVLGHRLRSKGILRSRNRRVADLLEADYDLYDLIEQIARLSSANSAKSLESRLGAIPGPILLLRVDKVVDALLAADAPHVVRRLLSARPELAEPYVRRLCADLRRGGRSPARVRTAFYLGTSPHVAGADQTECKQAVRHWLGRAGTRRIKPVTELVAQLSPDHLSIWQAWVAETRRGFPARFLPRRR